MKDPKYVCKCGKEVREKAVTPELAVTLMCPQCYTKHVTAQTPEKTITYQQAVASLVMLVQAQIIEGFKASTILATMFDVKKEQTMDDLMTELIPEKTGE